MVEETPLLLHGEMGHGHAGKGRNECDYDAAEYYQPDIAHPADGLTRGEGTAGSDDFPEPEEEEEGDEGPEANEGFGGHGGFLRGRLGHRRWAKIF